MRSRSHWRAGPSTRSPRTRQHLAEHPRDAMVLRTGHRRSSADRLQADGQERDAGALYAPAERLARNYGDTGGFRSVHAFAASESGRSTRRAPDRGRSWRRNPTQRTARTSNGARLHEMGDGAGPDYLSADPRLDITQPPALSPVVARGALRTFRHRRVERRRGRPYRAVCIPAGAWGAAINVVVRPARRSSERAGARRPSRGGPTSGARSTIYT